MRLALQESHLAHVNCCHVMPAAPAAAPAPEPAPAATTTGSTGLSASGDNETQNNNTQADPPAQAQANNTSAPPAAKGKGKGKVGAGGKDVLWAKELEVRAVSVWGCWYGIAYSWGMGVPHSSARNIHSL